MDAYDALAALIYMAGWTVEFARLFDADDPQPVRLGLICVMLATLWPIEALIRVGRWVCREGRYLLTGKP